MHVQNCVCVCVNVCVVFHKARERERESHRLLSWLASREKKRRGWWAEGARGVRPIVWQQHLRAASEQEREGVVVWSPGTEARAVDRHSLSLPPCFARTHTFSHSSLSLVRSGMFISLLSNLLFLLSPFLFSFGVLPCSPASFARQQTTAITADG